MEGYGSPIYWLETAPDELLPALDVTIRADVCIVGGGFTGLWTAYELKLAAPALEVVVLEAHEIAHGASGRNGGFAMTLLDMSLFHLASNVGDGPARAAHEAVAESVDEIGKVCVERDIDCEYVKGGLLVVATNAAQELRVRKDLETAERLGISDTHALSGDEVRARVDSPTYRSALFEESCAVIHPAKLNRGLKRVLIDMGVHVFEGTPVTGVLPSGDGARLQTPRGWVNCDQVVLATNAWASELPEFRHKVVPLYTYVVLTEPLSDERWDDVGWSQREGIEDKRNYVHYYRRTADGRILWGGTDGIVYRGRRKIRPRYDRNDEVFGKLEATFRTTFPQLADVRFTHRWGGPVGITSTFLPIFGTLDGGRVHYGLGYNGHGVAPSHTGGRILCDLVMRAERGYTDLFFVNSKEHSFPPEPLTWLAAALTRRALLKQDRKMDAGGAAGDMDPLVLRLTKKLG